MFGSTDGPSLDVDKSLTGKLQVFRHQFGAQYQHYLDQSTPHLPARWAFTGFVVFLYFLRVIYAGGWYIISYALGIYLLNLLIGFLSPSIDPETLSGESEDEVALPQTGDDEFKPFIRKLPEFKFWHSLTRACVIALLCTFVPFLNIPVFWPILLLYFIALFVVTMKKQIKHMFKHKYVPFVNWGKPKYQARPQQH